MPEVYLFQDLSGASDPQTINAPEGSSRTPTGLMHGSREARPSFPTPTVQRTRTLLEGSLVVVKEAPG